MKNKILFIGGPADGRVMYPEMLDRLYPRVKVFVSHDAHAWYDKTELVTHDGFTVYEYTEGFDSV